jgi:hypothetical protein
MKCPICKYEHGWSGEKMKDVTGKEGDFYRLPIKLEREDFGMDRQTVFGCPNPKCRNVFHDYE